MKLLRVIRSLNPICGGPVEGIKQITPYLQERGISTAVATLDSPTSAWLSEFSFDIHALGPVYFGYGYSPFLKSRFLQICASYDLIIIEGLWQYHTFVVWSSLKRSSQPYLIYPHGMLDPWFNRRYPLKYFKKSIYWQLIESNVFAHSSGILFTTFAEKSNSQSSFPLPHCPQYVVGFGASSLSLPTENELFDFYSAFPSLHNKKILLFFGRIHPKKGPDLLIRAFSRASYFLPNHHLVFAGPIVPSYYSYLSRLAISLGLDSRITWTGFLTGSMKSAAFATADLFCLPSYQENFGVAVAEALSIGLPVMVSSAIDISSRVSYYQAGLVHQNTADCICDALTLWSTVDHEQRSLFSTRASQLFSQEFDWKYSSSALSTLLKTLR